MARLNHARHQHRGRLSESALPYGMRRSKNEGAAKAANAGRSLNAEERAKVAASYGYAVA